jgi:hypothetical protein
MATHGMTGSGLIALSEVDPTIDAYRALDLPPGWQLMICPVGASSVCHALRLAFKTYPNEPWYGQIGENLGVESDGFEQRLVAAAGPKGVASGNDMWQAHEDIHRGRMRGAVVFGGDLLRALGYWSPEGFGHNYFDDVWETIGRRLGNWRTLMDVITPDLHPDSPYSGGVRRPADQLSILSSTMEQHLADRARFKKWLSGRRGACWRRMATQRIAITNRVRQRNRR